MKATHITRGLLFGVSALSIAGAAHAQDAAPVTDGQTDTAPAAQADTQAPRTEIVVTGSRVIKDGNNSPSPVTVVATDDLQSVQPSLSLSESLDILPAFAGSRGAGSNPSSTGSVGAGNGSANQLNLRNLGPEKTLVLIDGHRLAPTSFSGLVDVDTIPEMLIQRVDVVTGGASAVYGSDAVSGVVNYVIDKNFNGIKAKASSGISEYGDAASYNMGVAAGTDIGSRGHFEASYMFRQEEGVLRRSDRPWMNLAGITGLGTEANPYTITQGIRQKDFPFGGLITNGVLAGQTFKENGVLSPIVHGTPTGTSAIEIGGDGGYWDSSLLQPSKAHQVFARADYELTDSVNAYVQFSGNFKTDRNYADNIRLNNATFAYDNPFLADEYQQQLADAGQTTFRLREIMGNGPRVSAKSKSQQWMAFAGLWGDVGGYNWTLDYLHGRSKLDTVLRNNVNNQRLAYALDAVESGGNIVCNVTLTNPGLADDCVPLNVFGPTAASSEALDYVLGNVYFDAVTTMDDVTGSFAGSPFDTWAGPVNMAVSAEWRKVSFNSVSSSNLDDLVDCTGTRFNCDPDSTVWQGIFFTSPTVSQRVWEAAYEVDVPLLVDSPIARSLNVNGAVRYTDYDTTGSYWTWKLGVDWHLSDSLRFRATRSRDIRAPTLYDLYSPSNGSLISPVDLLTGTTPVVTGRTGSNPDLTAEIGNTLTGGVVWTPTPEFSIALDGYHITVSNAVSTVQGWNEAIQQSCYDSGGSSPFCDLQDRPNGYTDTSAANAVTGWYSLPINIAEIETYGADLEANYRSELFTRPFNARLLVAWQPHLYYRQPTVETRDQGGVAFGPLGTAPTPEFRVTGLVRFSPVEHLTVDVLQRWRSSLKISGIDSQVFENGKMDAFGTTSLTLTWDTDVGAAESAFFVSVSNLFDAKPPVGGYTSNGTRAGLRDGYAVGDDVRGRYFTAGFRIKM